MNAQDILGVDLTEPERLFPRDAGRARDEYHRLAKAWHPDVSKDPLSGDVIAHLNRLYEEALVRINAGVWRAPGHLTITGTDNKTRDIHYSRKNVFELGEMYYGKKTIVYILRKEFHDLYVHALKHVRGLRYASTRMEEEVSRYMPKILSSFTATTGEEVVVLEKTEDVFSLRDVVDHLGGRMEPRHVAWIMSSTLNVLCYLDHAGLTHNAVGVDTLFVSPRHHAVMLYGGWWYAAKAGGRLDALPAFAHVMCPPDILRSRRADVTLDLLLANAMGRELLGDRSGMSLTEPPAQMLRALRVPPAQSAPVVYERWFKALEDSFGARRFVELKITDSDIYDKGVS